MTSIDANAVLEHGEGAKQSNNTDIVRYQHSPHKYSFRVRMSRQQFRSIDERYQLYETLKKQLTASAITSAEYDVAIQVASILAGV
jgi:hypothetical protein